MCATMPRCHAPDLMGLDGTTMMLLGHYIKKYANVHFARMRAFATALVMATVLVFATTLSTAQEDKQSFHEAVGVRSPKHACETLQNIPLKSLENDVDVLSYEVFLDLYDGLLPLDDKTDTPPTYRASVDIRIVILSDTLTSIPLHADGITIDIDSAFVNGVLATTRRSRGKLLVTYSTQPKKNDTLHVRIVYNVDRVGGGGLVVSNGRDMARDLGSYPIAFTFSEPENSRRWYPCNDVPNDKALFRARARMPKGNRLVSNGELETTKLDGDTAIVETWSSPDVMPPYLFVMNASKFNQHYQLYSRDDGTGVPIRNFHWDTDESGFYKARYAVRNVPEMFKAFEPRFGRYPFRTYGHVAVHPVNIGGMEHQTMSTVSRRWLEGNAEVGYAHELGHQWLGDAVTCATWGDIWLNEGGATFSEALWLEHTSGEAGYRVQMMRRRAKYLEQGLSAPAVWDIPIGNLFNEATTYAKAAWVYHMMRRMLGDSLFFDKLQLYFTTFRGQSIQTAQFEEFWKQEVTEPLVNWDRFFDQWVMQRGHPIFLVRKTIPADQTNGQVVSVEQIQSGDGVPSVFHVPIRYRLYSEGGMLAEAYTVMRGKKTSVGWDGPENVDSVEVDPDMSILHETIVDLTVGVQEDPQSHACLSCPSLRVIGSNPAKENILLHITNATDASELALYDMRGLVVVSQSVGASQNALNIDATRLSAGVYVAVLTTRTGTASTRIVVQ